MKKFILSRTVGIGLLVVFTCSVNAQWVQISGPTKTSYISILAVDGSTIVAGTTGGGIDLSLDSGSSWNVLNAGIAGMFGISALAVRGSSIFASTPIIVGFRLSTDNGTSWQTADTGLTTKWITSFALSGNNIFAGTNGGGIFLSSDTGGHWSAIDSGLTKKDTVLCLAVSGGNIFAGSKGRGVFLSSNNGISWSLVNSGITNNDIRSFAVSGGNIFAGTYGGGVFLSSNNGVSWSPVNSGLTNKNALSFAVSGNKVFVGTLGGVFFTTDYGTNWIAANSGLTDTFVNSIAISGGAVFAATSMGGVWRLPLPNSAGVINPVSQGAMQNQTNLRILTQSHSTSNIIVEFTLHHADQVNVRIFNLSGHLINTILDNAISAGQHRLLWDIHGVASGCYVLKMTTGANTQEKYIPLFR